MINIDLNTYGFIKIKPSEMEIRGYLHQLCDYTDKRAFVQESYEVVNYIESKGLEIYNLSEVPIDEIKKILKLFKILPKTLFFHESDKFSKYKSPNFDKIIEHSLIQKYSSVFLSLDELDEYPENLTEDQIEKRKEKRRIRIKNEIEEEKKDLINFLPIFYESLQEVKMHEGKILIAYSICGNIIDIFSETGKKLIINDFEKEDEIDIWRESNSFKSYKISDDKKSILVNFLGRLPSWIIFEYRDKTFHLLKSNSIFGDNCPSNYYPPNEIDAAYKKETSLNQKLAEMPFSVTIGSQEWTTQNLDTSCFRNGDLIIEASTYEEWEAAAKSKSPAWCYYQNNPSLGEKYGKLYNWYAVNDPRGLAPEEWHIPSIEEWNKLALELGDNCNERLKEAEDWQPDHEMDEFFKMITKRNAGTNEDDLFSSKNEIQSKEKKESLHFNDTGFTALPGGGRGKYNNTFFAIHDSAYWWSSSDLQDDENQAYFVLLYEHDATLQVGNFTDKKVGYSIRCVRNK
jgi:hypothetical protein